MKVTDSHMLESTGKRTGIAQEPLKTESTLAVSTAAAKTDQLPRHRRRTAVFIPLSPKTPLKTAVVNYLHKALRRAKRLECSVVKMDRGGCLHDYRVLIRKARSIIGQLKAVFPEETRMKLRDDLAAIGNLTNAARDLEVYACRRKMYSKLLPANLQKGLEEFFKGVESRYLNERRRLSHLLSAPPYAGLIDQWIASLAERPPASEELSHSMTCVGDVALSLLPQRLSKLRSGLAGMGGDTGDAHLHDVRILCKKTRYLVEFLTPVLPPCESQMLDNSLSELQDKLGAINDLSVQITFLERALDDIFTGDEYVSAQTCAAVGAVFVQLRSHRNKAKSALEELTIHLESAHSGS